MQNNKKILECSPRFLSLSFARRNAKILFITSKKRRIEIMSRNFKKYKKDSSLGWSKTMEEVNTFIHECESKGIMKRL